MGRYTYDDVVRIVSTADEKFRPGATAWIIGVFEQRPPGAYFDQFPPGAVYTIEYENGEAIDIHESYLEPVIK